MKKKIVLLGGGGHCKVVIDAIRKSGKFDICGIADPNMKLSEEVLDVKVLGGDDILPGLFSKGVECAFISVGSSGDCIVRKRLAKKAEAIGFKFPAIVHPAAVIGEGVDLGSGAFVAAGAVISPGARIGANAIINTSASVDHDCIIGDFVHIAPGVTLSGGVNIGDETHIGTGANIIQQINIGKKCLVGAGTVVRDHMVDKARNYGGRIVGPNEKE